MAQMFEDLTLLLAPTSLTAAKEGLCHGKPFIVMKNDLRTRLVSDSSVSGTMLHCAVFNRSSDEYCFPQVSQMPVACTYGMTKLKRTYSEARAN